ncbi:MAG: SLBB domain-containing protein, partial [Lachnospiraceae bacterium]|nr:SLBB domain-containing protein [Lachnospiraceae bacterium]
MKNKKNYMLLFILLVFVTMGCADSDTDDIFVQLDEIQENTVVEEEIQTCSEEMKTDIEIENTIYVYICGAVVKPGVYDVSEDSRLFEVIQRADGFCNNADKTFLNLARQVKDGEQIIVYTIEETEELKKNGQIKIPENASSETVSQKDNGLIDINTATASELTTIKGIGE